MTTFERMFIDDKSVRAEEKDPYYTLVEKKEVCEAILADFGLHGEASRIVNGHVPVRVLDGEVPVRGGGKLIMIDGGFSRAYQSQTGIAGYTMFYNSFGIHLVSHQQFVGTEDAIRYNKDILSTHVVFDTAEERILVAQTDVGKMLKENIRDLKALLDAYRKWNIKEKDTKR